RLRPPVADLTSFYLAIAAGGALGGLLVSLLAPVLFDNYYEVHAGMILCGLLLAGNRTGDFIRSVRVKGRLGDEVAASGPRRSWGLGDWRWYSPWCSRPGVRPRPWCSKAVIFTGCLRFSTTNRTNPELIIFCC